MNLQVHSPELSSGLIPAILSFLRSENDVLRCAALRALPASGLGDDRVQDALVEAFLDPDPDVRTDAMDRFSDHAQPEDAEVILLSLEDDPVREVKLAAIRALATLRSDAALGLLRRLAIERCDDRVAWEDEFGDWEDWLDIQVAAIEALGHMGDLEAIPVLLAALDDEMGQTLDTPVFEALGRFGAEGVDRLVPFLSSDSSLKRQRAAGALGKVDPATLERHLDALLVSPLPALRQCALAALAPDDPRVPSLARTDPDPAVRRAALLRGAPAQPGLAASCLADQDEGVRAAALASLTYQEREILADDLLCHLPIWMQTASAELAIAACNEMVLLDPENALEPLMALAQDAERPLEARVTAVRGCAELYFPEGCTTLLPLLSNPAQQVRATAVSVFAGRAQCGDADAATILAEAIAGKLLAPDEAVAEGPEHEGSDLAVPKGEGGPRRIHITPDGDIVDLAEVPDLTPDAPRSTLDAIQLPDDGADIPQAEDTPEESGAKRRRRRSVEGPDQIAEDLSAVAMTMVRGIDTDELRAAIAGRAHPDDPLRAQAWTALSMMQISSHGLEELATEALRDPLPEVRLAALTCLERGKPPTDDLIETALADPDGPIRAWALRHADPARAVDALLDPSSTVLHAAARRLAKAEDTDLSTRALHLAVERERTQAVAALITAVPDIGGALAATLSAASLTERKALIVLGALASP